MPNYYFKSRIHGKCTCSFVIEICHAHEVTCMGKKLSLNDNVDRSNCVAFLFFLLILPSSTEFLN